MDKNFKFHNCNLDSEMVPLEEILRSKDEKLFYRWLSVKDVISSELRTRYYDAFPGAAADPVLHSEQCLNFLARILPRDANLSAEDLFIIMVALYIHDIGFVSQQKPYTQTLPSEKHYFVSSVIVEESKWLDLTNEERSVVSFLSKCHNKKHYLTSEEKSSKDCNNELKDVRIELFLAIMHICDDYHKLVDIALSGKRKVDQTSKTN